MKRVEAIEPLLREIQKKGTSLPSTVVPSRCTAAGDCVQEIRDVLDEYALTCKVCRILKPKEISKKFERLSNNLTLMMIADTTATAIVATHWSAPEVTAIAIRPAPVSHQKADERRVTAPMQTPADVSREAGGTHIRLWGKPPQ